MDADLILFVLPSHSSRRLRLDSASVREALGGDGTVMMMTMTPSKRKLLVEALLRLIRSDDGSQYLCYETAQNFLLILA